MPVCGLLMHALVVQDGVVKILVVAANKSNFMPGSKGWGVERGPPDADGKTILKNRKSMFF